MPEHFQEKHRLMIEKLRVLLQFKISGRSWFVEGTEVVIPLSFWSNSKPPTLGGLSYEVAETGGCKIAVSHEQEYMFRIHASTSYGPFGAQYTRANYVVHWKQIALEVESTVRLLLKEKRV